jgi:hypothetical protein
VEFWKKDGENGGAKKDGENVVQMLRRKKCREL